MSEPLPRLLLVEDEPVSRAFLAAAVEGLPLLLDQAATAVAALHLARQRPPALVLLDLHLPDGDGAGTLAALRAHGVDCPVVALTADAGARRDGPLAAAGFAAVAHKPLGREAVRTLVLRWLEDRRPRTAVADAANARAAAPVGVAEPAVTMDCVAVPEPDWDDAAALAALAGRADVLAQLRGLLCTDLPAQLAMVEATHADDPALACSVLHRLQAAAAFCGAARLAAVVRPLHAAVAQGTADKEGLLALRTAAAALLATPPAPFNPRR